jgi:DNA-binding response OmpR family regulator
MRILVVEDEKKVASFVQRGLEAEHYAVDVVGKRGVVVDPHRLRDLPRLGLAELALLRLGDEGQTGNVR